MSADDINNLGGLPDDVLVERAKDGDQDAFGILILRHRGEIYGCLMLVVRDDEIVKDIWQDASLKPWRRIGSLQDPS